MKKQGFTIVELLIVIVVIAILAAITAVAFNGVQIRSKNTAIEASVSSYVKILSGYAAQNGKYPVPDGGVVSYCLGEVASYPSNCYSASPNATFATELKKVASALPEPDPACYDWGGVCRRNLALTSQTSWQIDGVAHRYFIFYFLGGAAKCGLKNSLEGPWGSFTRTVTNGSYSRSGSTTMCVLEVDDPQ